MSSKNKKKMSAKIIQIENLLFEKMERRWAEQGFIDFKPGEPGYNDWVEDQVELLMKNEHPDFEVVDEELEINEDPDNYQNVSFVLKDRKD